MATVLSLLVLAAFALAIGAVFLFRRGAKKQAILMIVLAAIMAGNVALMTWPDARGNSPFADSVN